MPQISIIDAAGGGDYLNIPDFELAESEIDYGVGNTKEARCTGNVTASGSILGTWPRGLIITAVSGEEFNKKTLTGASITGSLAIASTGSTDIQVIGLRLLDGLQCNSTTAHIKADDCLINRSGLTAITVLSTSVTATVTGCITTDCDRACDASSGNTNLNIINHTSINPTGSFSYVRWRATNCLHLGTGTGFAAMVAGSDYDATDDTSAPGSNSLQNRTTADVVDFIGGDYRTAISSVLATAGDGGTHIGFAKEEVAGIIGFSGTISNQTAKAETNFNLDVSGFFTGSLTPFAYSIETGTLPAGLTLNTSTGVISGLLTAEDPQAGISITGEDTGTNTATSNTFDINVDVKPWGKTRAEIEASDENSGTDKPFLVDDFDVGDLSTDRFKFTITTQPTSGTFYVDEFSKGSFLGATEGSYFAVAERFKNGVSYGSANINLSIVTLPPFELSPQTVNTSSISLNPVFAFSSAFTLSPNTVNSSSVSLGPVFTFNSVFTLSPETVNSSSDSLDPNFTYSNAFTLNPQVVNSLSVSIDPSFTYTGPFNLSPNVVNSNSIALRPLFNYGQAQTIGTVTASFAPDLYTAQFKD